MPFFEKKQNFSRDDEWKRVVRSSPSQEGWGRQIIKAIFPRREAPKSSVQSPQKKDTSIFQGKPYLKRGEFRQKLRKASPFIPGAGGKIYKQAERVKIEKEVFQPGKWWKGGKFGHAYVTEKEFVGAIKGLEKKKFWVKTGAEKLDIDRKIRYLKGLLGKK